MSAPYSQEWAASISDSSAPACASSGNQKSTPTQAPCFASIGRVSQISVMLRKSRTPQQLMLFAEDSPVRTSVGQERAQASKAGRVADCGVNTFALLATCDPASSSWKTSQRCLSGGWDEFSETWPDSGTTRSGQLFRRAPWGSHMCDDECSLWPTPTASMDGRGFGIPLHERSGRYKKATVSRVRDLVLEHGWKIHPHFTEALMGFPSGWTEIEGLGTQSFPQSQKSSAGQS